MKKYLLSVLLGIVSLSVWAKGDIDPKYGVGAIVTNENGKVYFQQSFPIPSGMTQDQCYELMLNWAKGRFAQPFVQAGRVLTENAQSKRFVFHADQTITFKRTGLVADESRIEYNFSVAIGDNSVTATMTDIKYRYEEGREGGGQLLNAEDWITDEEAFNAKKTRFLKRTGKFRIKTIDLKDSLFDSISQTVAGSR